MFFIQVRLFCRCAYGHSFLFCFVFIYKFPKFINHFHCNLWQVLDVGLSIMVVPQGIAYVTHGLPFILVNAAACFYKVFRYRDKCQSAFGDTR